MYHRRGAHIDKLCQCLVCSGTTVHPGDVKKLFLSLASMDDKFRTEGVLYIVGKEGMSLACLDGPGLIRKELVNDRRFLPSVRVDPSDTDDALWRGQRVDEVCFTGKRVRVKVGNSEDCLVPVGMTGVDGQESTEGTLLVKDGKDMPWI